VSETTATPQTTARKSSIWRRLYNGETDFRIVGRWRIWFGLSAALIVAGLIAFGARGLNLGIDFTGGNQWEVQANGATPAEAEEIVEGLGFGEVKVQEVGDDLRIRTAAISGDDAERVARNAEVVEALTELTGVDAEDMVIAEVGPSWGEEISEKALRALVFFLIAILIYITIRFEFRMAIATVIALLHDVLIVVGAYALLQLPVTPATVVAVLTILGFSIYDGVVVFDRVDENTRLLTGSAKMTYSEMVDLSLNQVLMRSLNTQITALLPILSVLLVGSFALGATTLQEFGLALFIGQLSGAYSSLFIASPALALLKEREPRYKALRARLEDRQAAGRGRRDAEAALADGSDEATADATSTGAGAPAAARRPTASRSVASPGTVRSHPPRPRKKGKRR
jgi:preprotein translocase subunit SecF